MASKDTTGTFSFDEEVPPLGDFKYRTKNDGAESKFLNDRIRKQGVSLFDLSIDNVVRNKGVK